MAILVEGVRDGLTSATDAGKEMGLSTGTISKMATRAIEAGHMDTPTRGNCQSLATRTT